MIYVPMTANVLVVGHIRLLKKLLKKGKVVVGLLTSEALQGYKEERTPFKERLEILQNLKLPIKVVAQHTLSPENNLIKYRCTAIASGDGWEDTEKEVAKKLGIKMISINSGHPTHSSDIK